jgi:NAD-dependent SIR2 family protein deacetylase
MKIQAVILSAGFGMSMAAGGFAFSQEPEQSKAVAKERTYYLYCPECHLDMPWKSVDPPTGKYCPRCGKKKNILEVHEYSHEPGSPDQEPTIDATVATVVVAITGSLALLLIILSLVKRRMLRARPEAILHCRCPGCGRKFKYGPKQAGRRSQCTACKAPFEYPSVAIGSKKESAFSMESVPTTLEGLRKKRKNPT